MRRQREPVQAPELFRSFSANTLMAATQSVFGATADILVDSGDRPFLTRSGSTQDLAMAVCLEWSISVA